MKTVAVKTIRAKILELNTGKRQLLEAEYNNYQRYLRGEKDVALRAATKQQADRFLRNLKRNGGIFSPDREYPMIIRRDLYKAETKLTPYWFRFPVSGIKMGGLEVPVGLPTRIPINGSMRQAKLVREGRDWYIHILVRQEVEVKKTSAFLAIDMGIRNLATAVCSKDRRPRFYGQELRKNQAHYFKLRRVLMKKNAHGAVKRIGQHEQRVTDDILHQVSRRIVNWAAEQNATIIIGNLKGISKKRRLGRTFGRKLRGFPHWKLYKFLEYKAAWLGIPVMTISEAYTSQICHHCHSKGLRVGGRFYCKNCHHEFNADYNGAKNILERGVGHALHQGLILAQPESDSVRHHEERRRIGNLGPTRCRQGNAGGPARKPARPCSEPTRTEGCQQGGVLGGSPAGARRA